MNLRLKNHLLKRKYIRIVEKFVARKRIIRYNANIKICLGFIVRRFRNGS